MADNYNHILCGFEVPVSTPIFVDENSEDPVYLNELVYDKVTKNKLTTIFIDKMYIGYDFINWNVTKYEKIVPFSFEDYNNSWNEATQIRQFIMSDPQFSVEIKQKIADQKIKLYFMNEMW